MTFRNSLSLLLRWMFGLIGMRMVRLTTTKVRGLDPVLDLKFLLAGSASPTIFDIGANDGETASEFLKVFPNAKYYAFEPFQQCCDILQRKFGRLSNFRVEQCALGSERGTNVLNLYSGNRMNSFLELDPGQANPMSGKFAVIGKAQVAVETLDSYVEMHSVRAIDILKIDTQGFDLNVLKGGRHLIEERRVRTILLEVNFVSMYNQQASFIELHEFLYTRGYRLVSFYNTVYQNGYIAWCDACYVAADSPVPTAH